MAIKDLIQYFQQVRFELSKVEWPSFSEFVGSTIVVLFLVLVFAIYLGVIDAGFARVAKYIFKAYGGY